MADLDIIVSADTRDALESFVSLASSAAATALDIEGSFLDSANKITSALGGIEQGVAGITSAVKGDLMGALDTAAGLAATFGGSMGKAVAGAWEMAKAVKGVYDEVVKLNDELRLSGQLGIPGMGVSDEARVEFERRGLAESRREDDKLLQDQAGRDRRRRRNEAIDRARREQDAIDHEIRFGNVAAGPGTPQGEREARRGRQIMEREQIRERARRRWLIESSNTSQLLRAWRPGLLGTVSGLGLLANMVPGLEPPDLTRRVGARPLQGLLQGSAGAVAAEARFQRGPREEQIPKQNLQENKAQTALLGDVIGAIKEQGKDFIINF